MTVGDITVLRAKKQVEDPAVEEHACASEDRTPLNGVAGGKPSHGAGVGFLTRLVSPGRAKDVSGVMEPECLTTEEERSLQVVALTSARSGSPPSLDAPCFAGEHPLNCPLAPPSREGAVPAAFLVAGRVRSPRLGPEDTLPGDPLIGEHLENALGSH